MILGINFQEHNSRTNIYVFEFVQTERADLFEELLEKDNIAFEKEIHEKNGRDTIFYGVNKKDLKIAKNANYLVSAKYRKPFIADPVLRYFTLAFSAIIAVLIIMGYIFS